MLCAVMASLYSKASDSQDTPEDQWHKNKNILHIQILVTGRFYLHRSVYNVFVSCIAGCITPMWENDTHYYNTSELLCGVKEHELLNLELILDNYMLNQS